ncbi:MAG: thioredoxin fold domain-containing protein [Candidatus Desulfofervidaceae bacterium]|nr:thioredoxin fold domain-containing protein [Candidatus Desulfofervidaceae bacterium]
MATIKAHLSFALPSGSQIISKRPVKGLCEVILKIKDGNLPLYIALYVGNDFVILGQMYSHKENIPQSQIGRIQAKTFKDFKAEIEKVVAITYKPSPTPTHVVYMFTNPLCPCCHRAEGKIKQVANKYNVILKMVFLPIHLSRGKDKEKAIEVVCRKLDLNAYLKRDWEKENKTKEYQCKRGKQLIEDSINLGEKLGVTGVPTFFLDNGSKVVGADIKKLETALTKLIAGTPFHKK